MEKWHKTPEHINPKVHINEYTDVHEKKKKEKVSIFLIL